MTIVQTSSVPLFSVALTADLDAQVRRHFAKGPQQEDLTFALWRPSQGCRRLTAVLHTLVLPEADERILHGNVAFLPGYVHRVLQLAEQQDSGIALLHSHLGPGWQGLSEDDTIAERDRLADAITARTKLPLVGLTWGTDGAWSARCWQDDGARNFTCHWASAVRVVGEHLQTTYHPEQAPAPGVTDAQVATVSVWGAAAQAEIARTHVGIVGLGSVGSLVAETLSRMGVTRFTLIDQDRIEVRNLDRTAGAWRSDAIQRRQKVQVACRHIAACHTAPDVIIDPYPDSLLTEMGLLHALDCDVLFSCVDRPMPRHALNAIAYAHLIPVVDGGILAQVQGNKLLHVDWRIHTVGPERACLICLGAVLRTYIALDREGKLDDPVYIQGLDPALRAVLARQNVYPFSMSVAAHMTLQFVGLVTGQQRVGGIGSQHYAAYPGRMEVMKAPACQPDCEYAALLASAADLRGNCIHTPRR